MLKVIETTTKLLVLGRESFQLKYNFAIEAQVKVSADMIMKEVGGLEISLIFVLFILYSCNMDRMYSSKTLT